MWLHSLVAFLADAQVIESIAGGRGPIGLELARRIALSHFYTQPTPQSLDHLMAAWMGGDSANEAGKRTRIPPFCLCFLEPLLRYDVLLITCTAAASASAQWVLRKQSLVLEMAAECVPQALHVPTILDDVGYCAKLAVLGRLEGWDSLRDTALRWWKQGNHGTRLKAVECGAACLFILTGAKTRSAASGGAVGAAAAAAPAGAQSLVKQDPSLQPAVDLPGGAGSAGGGNPPGTGLVQKQSSNALSGAALYGLCVGAVVPYCVAYLQQQTLGDTMPLATGCELFDGLVRWTLVLGANGSAADGCLGEMELAQLRQQQAALMAAVDAATVSSFPCLGPCPRSRLTPRACCSVAQARVAAAALTDKVSARRKETIVGWLQLACAWAIAAAKVRARPPLSFSPWLSPREISG